MTTLTEAREQALRHEQEQLARENAERLERLAAVEREEERLRAAGCSSPVVCMGIRERSGVYADQAARLCREAGCGFHAAIYAAEFAARMEAVR